MITKLANLVRGATSWLKHCYNTGVNLTLPTYTIAAAFTLSSILGVLVVSGILLKPYEAREVVLGWHERVQMEIEYREFSRISYSAIKAAFSTYDLE